MVAVLRFIGGLLAGVVVGGIFVFAIERVGMVLHPPPEGADMTDPATVAAHMESAPVQVLLLVLLAHLVGTAAGAWVAASIASRARLFAGLVVGLLFLAGGIANMWLIPHPVWFNVADLLVFLPAALLGTWLALRRRVPPAPKDDPS